MKIKTLIKLTLIAIAAFSLGGCGSKDRSSSKIPWSRPASWEGGMPGLGM